MHPNPAFRGESVERSVAFARERSFGVLAVNGDGGPFIAHVPFLLSGDAATADLHLVRSNPIARLDGVAAVIAVSGPDGYISPDWYGVDDQVPTWNYVAVHLRGTLERLPDAEMRDMLDRQSSGFEERLLPKRPWKIDKMTPGEPDRKMRMILPFRLRIAAIDGTWKLGQNKTDAARRGAADGMEAAGIGHETGALARLMREASPPDGD